MSILVLGSHSYQLVPDVNGDPITISPAGNVPAVTSGVGAPSGVPTYGNGTLYVDTTNNMLYIYKVTVWTPIGAPLPDNLIYVLDKTTTDAIITGAGPSNTLSYVVPGGTLGTNKILRTKLSGKFANGGGTRTITLAISYGGTTLYADTSPSVASNGTVGWELELLLAANGSTSSQQLTGRIQIGGTGTSTVGGTGDMVTDEILSTAILNGVVATVDSTVNQSLNVTVTFSSSGGTWTKRYHTIELI